MISSCFEKSFETKTTLLCIIPFWDQVFEIASVICRWSSDWHIFVFICVVCFLFLSCLVTINILFWSFLSQSQRYIHFVFCSDQFWYEAFRWIWQWMPPSILSIHLAQCLDKVKFSCFLGALKMRIPRLKCEELWYLWMSGNCPSLDNPLWCWCSRNCCKPSSDISCLCLSVSILQDFLSLTLGKA